MNITIVGGTGFLGKHLARHILQTTDWSVKCVSHTKSEFEVPLEHRERIEFVVGDALNKDLLKAALTGSDVVYYFVHMMGQKTGNFYELETKAANIMKQVGNDMKLKRLVYMGGLGSDDDALSDHLASRHRTGKILRSSSGTVIEFQASMVVGRGSVAFDIIASLVDKLPVMPLPRTASTLTQPILLSDALSYLLAAVTVDTPSTIVQIGGPDVMSYEDIYRMYARHVRKERKVFRVPLLPARLEAIFLDWFTPSVHAKIGQAMVESLGNEMIVTSSTARTLFPDIEPQHIEASLKKLAQ